MALIDPYRHLSRKPRPPAEQLPPWEPAKSATTILELLLEYRYLTTELVALLYQARRAMPLDRGRDQVRKELTKLWRYQLVERFRRPVDWGRDQYVYTLSLAGGRLVVDPKDWSLVKPRIYNLSREKQNYEHAIAVSLVRLLWELGSLSQMHLFETAAVWNDQAWDGSRVLNRFEADVAGEVVLVHPDLTVLLKHRPTTDFPDGYFRPVFFEIDRSRKNHAALRRRFRAYAHLLGRGRRTVQRAFARHEDVVPIGGMAVFVASDPEHAGRIRRLARDHVGPRSQLWFTSIDRLLQTVDGRAGRTEAPIAPAAFFREDLLTHLNGRRGKLVI